jgi:uncharacterized protein YegP (UPF0339 family)
MATATPQQHTTRQAGPRTTDGSEAIAFVVFEDNAGDYRWSIRGSRGESLAQSEIFATYAAAHTAAGSVRNAAGSSRFDPQPADLPTSPPPVAVSELTSSSATGDDRP